MGFQGFFSISLNAIISVFADFWQSQMRWRRLFLFWTSPEMPYDRLSYTCPKPSIQVIKYIPYVVHPGYQKPALHRRTRLQDAFAYVLSPGFQIQNHLIHPIMPSNQVIRYHPGDYTFTIFSIQDSIATLYRPSRVLHLHYVVHPGY